MVTVNEAIHDLAGVKVGHATLQNGQTGCTVIAFDEPTLTAAEVRGAAPGTREIDLLAPGRTVQRADAILLSGGSAFGLRAATGIVQELARQGRGYPTPAMPVPIVPGAVIFDLRDGNAVIPSEGDGARAFASAEPLSQTATGEVGVGRGATWGGIRGMEQRQQGGFAIAQIELPQGSVTALAVVNAFGVVASEGDPRPQFLDAAARQPPLGQNTTLISVVTDIECDHSMLGRMCVAAHDALARTIWPAHTLVDGDVAFASTTHAGVSQESAILPLTLATELAVEASLLRAAYPATISGGQNDT